MTVGTAFVAADIREGTGLKDTNGRTFVRGEIAVGSVVNSGHVGVA